MKRQKWVITWDYTQGEKAYAMECLRCGALQKVALPISIEGYVGFAKVFSKEHAKCKERIE